MHQLQTNCRSDQPGPKPIKEKGPDQLKIGGSRKSRRILKNFFIFFATFLKTLFQPKTKYFAEKSSLGQKFSYYTSYSNLITL